MRSKNDNKEEKNPSLWKRHILNGRLNEKEDKHDKGRQPSRNLIIRVPLLKDIMNENNSNLNKIFSEKFEIFA